MRQLRSGMVGKGREHATKRHSSTAGQGRERARGVRRFSAQAQASGRWYPACAPDVGALPNAARGLAQWPCTVGVCEYGTARAGWWTVGGRRRGVLCGRRRRWRGTVRPSRARRAWSRRPSLACGWADGAAERSSAQRGRGGRGGRGGSEGGARRGDGRARRGTCARVWRRRPCVSPRGGPSARAAHPRPSCRLAHAWQEYGRLPLHWAAYNSESVAVVEALLRANPQAAEAKDDVRRPCRRARVRVRVASRRCGGRGLAR